MEVDMQLRRLVPYRPRGQPTTLKKQRGSSEYGGITPPIEIEDPHQIGVRIES